MEAAGGGRAVAAVDDLDGNAHPSFPDVPTLRESGVSLTLRFRSV